MNTLQIFLQLLPKMVLSLICLLSLTPKALGDILFLDLNDSPLEIAAAKAAAAQRGSQVENVRVLPAEWTKAQATQLAQYSKIIVASEKKIKKLKCGLAPTLTKECVKISEEKENAYNNRAKLYDSRYLSLKNAETEFQKLEDLKIEISSLVISGHHSGGDYSGRTGQLDDQAFRKFSRQFPNTLGKIQVLILMGCETANLGACELIWKPAFPSLKLILGFSGSAPLSQRPAGSKFLTNVILREKELLAADTKDAVETAFAKIKDEEGMLLAGICVNGLYKNTEMKDVLDVENRQQLCIPTARQAELRRAYACYNRATEERCANPPDPGLQNSPLHKFYEYVNEVSICNEIPEFKQYVMDLPTVKTIVRLRHFTNIKKNVNEVIRSQVAETDQILDQLRAPAYLRFGDLPALSRMALRDLIRNLTEFVDDQWAIRFEAGVIKGSEDILPELTAIKNFLGVIQTNLIEISSYCVPLGWIDEDPKFALKESNSCLTEPTLKTLGFSGVQKERDQQASYDKVQPARRAHWESELLKLKNATPPKARYSFSPQLLAAKQIEFSIFEQGNRNNYDYVLQSLNRTKSRLATGKSSFIEDDQKIVLRNQQTLQSLDQQLNQERRKLQLVQKITESGGTDVAAQLDLDETAARFLLDEAEEAIHSTTALADSARKEISSQSASSSESASNSSDYEISLRNYEKVIRRNTLLASLYKQKLNLISNQRKNAPAKELAGLQKTYRETLYQAARNLIAEEDAHIVSYLKTLATSLQAQENSLQFEAQRRSQRNFMSQLESRLHELRRNYNAVVEYHESRLDFMHIDQNWIPVDYSTPKLVVPVIEENDDD